MELHAFNPPHHFFFFAKADDSGEDPKEGFFLKARVVYENENSDSNSEMDNSDNDSKVNDTESEDPEEVLFAKAGF